LVDRQPIASEDIPMPPFPSDIAFTSAVKAIQSQKGSRGSYARMEQEGGWQTTVTPELAEFLAGLDMFYLGTANAAGQPYIQYRGGQPGFLQVIDERTLGFADFGGNRQYISLGNLSENPQAFLFLIDYVNRRRIKLWGTARVVEDDRELVARLATPRSRTAAERAIVFTIAAWDVNCQQHIHQRLSRELVMQITDGQERRIADLEKRIRELESELAKRR
jgi:uncharacterized protein